MAVIVDCFEEAALYGDPLTPMVIAGNERTQVLQFCFEPGQLIPVHSAGVDATLVVLKGNGLLVAGDREARIEAGSVAFVPAGERRGVTATTRLVVLEVLTAPGQGEARGGPAASGVTRGGQG